jgi:hypothetical protein
MLIYFFYHSVGTKIEIQTPRFAPSPPLPVQNQAPDTPNQCWYGLRDTGSKVHTSKTLCTDCALVFAILTNSEQKEVRQLTGIDQHPSFHPTSRADRCIGGRAGSLYR